MKRNCIDRQPSMVSAGLVLLAAAEILILHKYIGQAFLSLPAGTVLWFLMQQMV